MRVYVAGPYSSNPTAGTRAAILAASRLADAGHTPFVPHLSYFWDLLAPRPYTDWIRIDLEWVAQCEALVRLPGDSPGADREVAHARELGIPVYEGVSQFLRDQDVRRMLRR